jgi:hypothetical protein
MSRFNELAEKIEAIRLTLRNDVFEGRDLDSFSRTLSYVEHKLKVSDFNITAPSQITELITTLTSLEGQLNNFIQARQESEFSNASVSLHQVAKSASGFIEISSESGRQYFMDAQKISDESIQSLKKDIKALENQLTTLQADSANLISELKKSFDELVSGNENKPGWAKQISDSLILMEKLFNEELNGNGGDKLGWVASGNAIQAQLNEILEEGKNLGRIIGVDGLSKADRKERKLTALRAIKDSSNWLLSQIGLGASIGGYQSRANKEALSGIFWTASIIGIFILLIVLNKDILDAYKDHITAKTLPEFLTFRFVISIPFIAFMGFAGFKAKNHRKMELKYRQFELELAAFEPNLASLSKDMRALAKLMFIQKIFGQIDGVQEREGFDPNLFTASLAKLAEEHKKMTNSPLP